MNEGARTGNGFSVLPISFCEIEAWARLTGRVLRPFEVTAIKRLDGEYRAWLRGEKPGEPERPQSLVKQIAALKEGKSNGSGASRHRGR